MGAPNHRDEAAVEKIQAKSKINNGANNGWLINSPLARRSPGTRLDGKLVSALCVEFPKIGAISKPVIVILTRFDRLFASENALGYFSIASVITKHEARG